MKSALRKLAAICGAMGLVSCGAPESGAVPEGMAEGMRGDMPSAGNAQASAAAKEFSADDKRAAQALSVGAAQIQTGEGQAYDQSIACAEALAVVENHFAGSDGGIAAQLETIRGARTRYEQRIEQQAAPLGKTGEEIANDRAAFVAKEEPLREQAQRAIGCLRALA